MKLNINGEIKKLYNIQNQINDVNAMTGDVGILSDGCHTFNELYYHRMILFSIICNTYEDKAWKSWKHSDNTMFDDYFIVGLSTKEGDYSYHYHKNYWDMFKVKEIENSPAWDGHKPSDIDRLLSLLTK